MSRCDIGGNAVAFLPYNDTGSSKLIHLAAFCSYTNTVSMKLDGIELRIKDRTSANKRICSLGQRKVPSVNRAAEAHELERHILHHMVYLILPVS